MAAYSVETVRTAAVYRIESQNSSCYWHIVDAIDEPRLDACAAELDEWHKIRLVVDVTSERTTKTFVSDGRNLFTQDLKRCRPIDEAFKDVFRLRGSGGYTD